MRRAWGVLIAGLLGLTAALITGRDLYFYIAYLSLGALIVCALWVWSAVRSVGLSRRTSSTHSQVGRPFEEYFTLRNSSWLPKLWLVVHDDSDVPGYSASRVVHNLGPQREFSWTGRVICEKRGRFRLGPMAISSSDPLGLFELRRELPRTSSVLIYPATVPLRRLPQLPGYLPGGDSLRRRTHDVTANASGVRDYLPGDGFNRVHWRSTARKDRLIVKEFELDPMLDTWIFLDMHHEVHVRVNLDESEVALRRHASLWRQLARVDLDPSTEEYAVTAAASLAQFLIRSGRSVGMVAYGQAREIIQPDRGERQLGKILEALAALRAVGKTPFEDVLSGDGRRPSRGSTIIAISPSVSLMWAHATLFLDRSAIRFVNVLVDAASFGGRGDASTVRDALRSTGWPVITLHRDDSLEEVLSANASPSEAGLVTGLHACVQASV
ncbi:MAG: DUF58 domain-containing protein [Chloroflexi bacterium]|nr:DUF58 domain-containing protein [Chloroflexota bacterium]